MPNITFLKTNIENIADQAVSNLSFDTPQEDSVPAGKKRQATLHNTGPNTSRCPQIQDEYFLNYNANRILETSFGPTPFIAGEGPRASTQTAFFRDVIFNEHHKINIIIAVVKVTRKQNCSASLYDCYDYFFNKEISHESYKTQSQTDNQQSLGIFCSNGQIIMEKAARYDLTVTNTTDQSSRRLNVYNLPIPDGKALEFDLNHAAPAPDIHYLLEISQRMAKYPQEEIFVHCAAGIGRTAHIIITLLLLHHFNEIFDCEGVDVIAKRIVQLVKDLRQHRMTFLIGKQMGGNQLKQAIQNALHLREIQLKLERGELEETPDFIFRATSTAKTQQELAEVLPVNYRSPLNGPMPLATEPVVVVNESAPLLSKEDSRSSCCLII